jgi:lysozyme
MGVQGLLGFTRMLEAVRAGDWKQAFTQMLNSRWARQVKRRAPELAAQMESGVWQSDPWRDTEE